MKKIQDRGNEYVQNEQDRLGRLLSELYHPQTTQELESSPFLYSHTTEGDISAKKSDELTKRRNVLKKFELWTHSNLMAGVPR